MGSSHQSIDKEVVGLGGLGGAGKEINLSRFKASVASNSDLQTYIQSLNRKHPDLKNNYLFINKTNT